MPSAVAASIRRPRRLRGYRLGEASEPRPNFDLIGGVVEDSEQRVANGVAFVRRIA